MLRLLHPPFTLHQALKHALWKAHQLQQRDLLQITVLERLGHHLQDQSEPLLRPGQLPEDQHLFHRPGQLPVFQIRPGCHLAQWRLLEPHGLRASHQLVLVNRQRTFQPGHHGANLDLFSQNLLPAGCKVTVMST